MFYTSMQTAQELFQTAFQRPCALATLAPGRVNIIGEHTDYNGGWVMPMPLPLSTYVAVGSRGDGTVRVTSSQTPGHMVTFDLMGLAPTRDWADYVRGMCSELQQDGCTLGGMDVAITSTVPVGAGLSSSAALEVAFGRAVRQLCGLRMDDVQLAQLGQRCENHFVGAHVGIMDQMACSVGRDQHMLLLNTNTLEFEHVPMPNTVQLGVIHSGVEHSHAGGEYNARRRECETAAKALGVAALCALDNHAMSQIETLQEPMRRRARHVVSENQRVHATAQALRDGDLAAVGNLLRASHASLRDDYEVSVQPVDALVAAANVHEGCVGARITGGGFGGCIVLLAKPGQALAVAEHAVQQCREVAPAARVVL